MIEALWSVEFVANTHSVGSGVVVVENGKVLGGDAQYFYVGHCNIENGTVRATADITHYSGPINSVFGTLKTFRISVSGRLHHDAFTLNGCVEGMPSLRIDIRFTRRAELP